MIILWLVFIISIILILPIFLTLICHFDSQIGRVNFSIILFGCVKIISGYLMVEGVNLFIHYSNNNAIMINLKTYKPQGGVKNLKSIEFINFNYFFNFENKPNSVGVCSIFTVGLYMGLCVLKSIKNNIRICGRIKVGGETENNYFFKTTFFFNIITILQSLLNSMRNKNE